MKPFVLTVVAVLALTTSLSAQTMLGHHYDALVAAETVADPAGSAGVGGQCCEDDVSYCQSLWANYCQERRNCRHTCSPRHSICGHPGCVGGCGGFPFNTGACCRPAFGFPLLSGLRIHHGRAEECASDGCATGDSYAAEGGTLLEGPALAAPAPAAIGSGAQPTPADEPPSAEPPQPPAAPQPAAEAPAEEPAPPAPPAPPTPDESARRWYLPFLRVK